MILKSPQYSDRMLSSSVFLEWTILKESNLILWNFILNFAQLIWGKIPKPFLIISNGKRSVWNGVEKSEKQNCTERFRQKNKNKKQTHTFQNETHSDWLLPTLLF